MPRFLDTCTGDARKVVTNHGVEVVGSEAALVLGVRVRVRVRVGVRFRVRVRVTLQLRRQQLRARRLQLSGALLLLAAQRHEGAPLRRW